MLAELIINSIVGMDKMCSAQYSAWHIEGTQEMIARWIGGWVNRQMEGWMSEQMDGWVDGWLSR